MKLLLPSAIMLLILATQKRFFQTSKLETWWCLELELELEAVDVDVDVDVVADVDVVVVVVVR